MDYNKVAKDILDNVGGKANVKQVTHCFTRLRFVLRDESKAKKEVVEHLEGVISVVVAGGQFQVVCGAKVTKIYDAVVAQLGGQAASSAEEEAVPAQKQSLGNLILQKLTETNFEKVSGYGTDPYCASAREKIRAACACPEADVQFISGGTQSNAIVIASMLQRWQGVVAAATGHVAGHEAGAIEYTGHKVITLPQHNGKLDAAELRALAKTLEASGGAVRLDLSLAGEMEYYNGLVFQGYLKALPRPLLKGGRYDLLLQKFTPGAGAIGFAVYLDELDRLNAMPPVQHQDTGKVMLNVALPKGRLGDKVYNLLAGIGYGCPEDYNATRKLVVENPAAGIRYFLVKPSDVAIYVEHGAADVGIVGKDILTEAAADVYELLDTGLGRCRMCVAAPAGYRDDPSRPVRVATKFVNIAKRYYASMGRDIDIIKLNGSIELAPILGLSDVIVDIVETGTTLRENGLQVVTEFMPISARFIANKASYQFKHRQMDTMLEKLRDTLHKQEEEK